LGFFELVERRSICCWFAVVVVGEDAVVLKEKAIALVLKDEKIAQAS
jgi:hypothetical protein